jgi:4-hydroxy-tetrahydrodipicolinate synthase
MTKFGRLLTAMVTPFDADGNVDYAQARKLARALIQSGSDGLVVSGTTGESPTLSIDEKLRLFAEVKQELAGAGAVIAGTGNYSTR